MADRFYMALAKTIYWFLDVLWRASEKTPLKNRIQSKVTTWEIRTNAFMGRVLFQNKIKLHFDDEEKQEALETYLNWELDGDLGAMRKGVDGFITFGFGTNRRYNSSYEIRVLETKESDNMEYGARLAAGSPRVYVKYRNGKKLEWIRVSIDEQNPRILDGDERDCPGADFPEIFEFIKKCYVPIIGHWEGSISSKELYECLDLRKNHF